MKNHGVARASERFGSKTTIYFIVDDNEMAVKVNAVIYVGRDQEKQMADRGLRL